MEEHREEIWFYMTRGLYIIGGLSLLEAIVRWRLWDLKNSWSVPQVRHPLSHGLTHFRVFLGCQLSFLVACWIFLYEFIDFLFLKAELADQVQEKGVPVELLFSSAHHILSIALIWNCCILHRLSPLAIYAGLSEHFFNASGVLPLLLPQSLSSFHSLWRSYELTNIVCFLATVIAYLRWNPEGLQQAGAGPSMICSLGWTSYLQVLNLVCNTHLSPNAEYWKAYPLHYLKWAKSSVVVLSVIMLALFTWVGWTRNKRAREETGCIREDGKPKQE